MHKIHRGVLMLCRRKVKGARRRIRRYICVILVAAVLFTVYFEVAVRVQLTEVIRTRMRTVAQTAVNSAVGDFLSENADIGERLTELCLTDGGAVAAIRTDPSYINYVKQDISLRSQEYIDRISRGEGIKVPLGSFSGLMFLNSVGPEVSMTIESSQTVSCTFVSTFDSAGINQSLHHIRLIVHTDIAVYSPFRIYDTISVTSDYEIAQTVVVGSVPTYGGVVTY